MLTVSIVHRRMGHDEILTDTLAKAECSPTLGPRRNAQLALMVVSYYHKLYQFNIIQTSLHCNQLHLMMFTQYYTDVTPLQSISPDDACLGKFGYIEDES